MKNRTFKDYCKLVIRRHVHKRVALENIKVLLDVADELVTCQSSYQEGYLSVVKKSFNIGITFFMRAV